MTCKLVDYVYTELSVSRQYALLNLSKTTLYYYPSPVRKSALRIMEKIDTLYLEDPCIGSRRMVVYLATDRIPIIRDRVHNFIRSVGLLAIYQKPRTTVPGDPSEELPYLVDVSAVMAVYQVWTTDITYIPLQKGFHYLATIDDLFSRHVLSWKVSNSLDTEFCLEAIEMVLDSNRKPDVFHSDQSCHFTSSTVVTRMQADEIKIR